VCKARVCRHQSQIAEDLSGQQMLWIINEVCEVSPTPPKYLFDNHLGLKSLTDSLREELISFMASILHMPEGSANGVQRFLSDVKVVIMEVAPLNAILCSYDASAKLETETTILNLLAKIWLIKIEIFL
jgi:hypothetical protein